MVFTRKYGSTATIRIPLLVAAGTSFATDSTWTPASGDVLVSKDGGTDTNITTLPSYANGQWTFTLSATEMTCQSVLIKIINAAILCDALLIESYGNSNAMYQADFNASGVDLTNGAITSSVFDGTTAFPVTSADTGSTRLARTGADSDTLETLSDQLDTTAPASTALSTATWTETKAGYLDATISSRSTITAADVWASGTRTLTSFGTLIADIWAYATRTLSAFAFTPTPSNAADVTAIKAKTDNLPASPAAVGSAMTLTSAYDAAKTAAPASTALSNATWTDTKAGYLDAAISSRSTLTAAQVWDEILTDATHNIASSAGRRLRQIASQVVYDGTARGAGNDNNQIQLDTAASSVNGAYDPSVIAIVNGTGAGQCRLILEYDGATRMATVDRGWKVQPDATSEFVIFAHPGREHVNEGLAQGGTTSSITLNALASSIDSEYVNQQVIIRSGTGEDQVRIITSYDGTTKTATVNKDWAIAPDSTSGYVLLPSIVNTYQDIRDALLLAPTTGLTAATNSIDDKIDSIGSGTGSGSGSGDTEVNHNTGGTDTMRCTTSAGLGISGVSVRAYVASEWDSNPLTATLRAEVFTGDDGRWVSSMMLTSGVTYTFVFEKSGEYGPNELDATV